MRDELQYFSFSSSWLIVFCSDTDVEAAAICNDLSNLLEERFAHSPALRDRLAPLQDNQKTTTSGITCIPNDCQPPQSGQRSATSELNHQIERELHRSRAYTGYRDQGAYGSSINEQGSLRTTTTADTFYSVLSAIRVPVAESELAACRPDSENHSLAGEGTRHPGDDWGLLDNIAGDVETVIPDCVRDSSRPIWAQRLNFDSMNESPWARKVVLTLGMLDSCVEAR